ncbi:PPOX class F420-dependent oxidoreductase [Mycolicibacterium sp. Dal123E01]|uniref:PPOX class F420-dependent oxidoreductase n=1 Tax=Mycolicibacterium sp. Dal123E01 TaxID=3457578 RepID=UPI00403E4DB3
MALTFADVVKAKYITLTTFTKDDRPKPTAVWVVAEGDTAVVISEKNAWKVKRIRNTPRVTVAICDMRGNVKSEAVEAVAAVLDESQTERVYQAIGRRYGIVGHVFNFFSKLRGGTNRTVGLELRAA